MRRTFIAGNWKMNLDRSGAVGLATQLKEGSQRFGDVEVGICPPSVYLDAVCAAVGDLIGVGAQNLYHQPSGAYTGELSASMLKDVGCRYVILGHSERRHVLGETNADVSKKLIAALAAGVTPILCVGETLAQREAGQTNDIVAEQFYGSLAGVDAERAATVVIAYEPVWAIGTGRVPNGEQIGEMHRHIRDIFKQTKFGDVGGLRVLYGGSVKAENAAEILSIAGVDGALVGGASLSAENFWRICAHYGQ